MKALYTCTSVKEFNDTVKSIRPHLFTDIDCIYNIGDSQYYDHPLFIFTLHHVFRIYFSDSTLSLAVYNTETFLKHIEGDIFRERDNTTDFDYLHPEAYYPNTGICNLISAKGCGVGRNLKGFDFTFSDGKHLCIRESDLIHGTMDSWISE